MTNLVALVCVMMFLLIGGIAIVVYAERRQDREAREAEEAREKTLQAQVDLIRSR